MISTAVARHYYIPPDVGINVNGTTDPDDYGKVYKLNSMYDKWLMSFTGLGMPPIQYITQRGPQQHGSQLLDFRLQERFIQYIHRRKGCNASDYWDNRSDIINWIRPNRQAVNCFSSGRLRVVMPNNKTRDIMAIIQDGPAFAAKDPSIWDAWSFTEALRFKCHDPTWFNPARSSVTWTVTTISGLLFYDVGLEDHLIFPDNAIFSSDILSGTEISVPYTGTWFGYPTIVITGPIIAPTITNTLLGIKISLNYEVSVGEVITITTDYGNKTITNQLGTSLIGTKTTDSDMNFYLAPDPTAPGGINTFTATGSGASELLTSIVMYYNTRDIGI